MEKRKLLLVLLSLFNVTLGHTMIQDIDFRENHETLDVSSNLNSDDIPKKDLQNKIQNFCDQDVDCSPSNNYLFHLDTLLAITGVTLTLAEGEIFAPKLEYPSVRQYRVINQLTPGNNRLTDSVVLFPSLSSLVSIQSIFAPISSAAILIPASLASFSFVTPAPLTISLSSISIPSSLLTNPISLSGNPSLWLSGGPISVIPSIVSHPVSLSANLSSVLSPPVGLLSSAKLHMSATSSNIIMSMDSSSKMINSIATIREVSRKEGARMGYHFPKYDFSLQNKKFEFRNLVTFGDSLSDNGSIAGRSVYMATGNPAFFYNSLLSIYFTGKLNISSTGGGTNYAVSGALIKWSGDLLQLVGDPLSVLRSRMPQQIEQYLVDNGGNAHPDDIFVLWGGGNDMTGDILKLAMFPSDWKYVRSSDGNYLNDKAITLGSYAQWLSDVGAKNVLVLGLPDSGVAPFSGVAIMSLFSTSALGMMDDYLRNNANLVGSPVGNADEYFIDNYARMYHHFVPFIPTELWRWAVVIPAQLQRNLVIRWNNDLQNRLRDVNGNVVYADMYRLYEEVQNNPYVYGFTNTLVAQCTLGKESTICDAEDSYYHGDDGQVYMYTDWHHPSPQMNQIIAEYLLTIFNAPGYVSGLSRVSEMNEGVRANFMKNEMKYMRFDERAVGEFTTFASVLAGVDKNSRSLNPRNLSTQGIGTGFAYRAAEGLDVGASLALTYGDKHPSNQLKYRDSLQVLTGFIQYRDPNGFWGNGQVYTGWEQMNDIKRSMQFLKHVRTEQGETEGKISGFGLSLGYDILLSENGCNTCTTHWYATPYVGGSVTKYKVKGYQEEGNSSTAMEFKEQVRTDKLGTLGVQIVSKSPKLNTNLDLAYTRAFDHEEFKVEGRLKNFAKDFHRSDKGISKERKGWVSLTPSVEYKLNDQFSVYGNINYNYGNNKFTQLNGSIGIRSKF